MKITINVFMLKEGRAVQDALNDEVNLQPIAFELNGVDCLFYHQKNPSHPKWTQLFKDIEEVVALDLTRQVAEGTPRHGCARPCLLLHLWPCSLPH